MLPTKTVDLPIGPLAYRECGAAGGTPLILVHGWTGSGHNFEEVLPLLGEHYRTIALDLPGHGRSVKPPRQDYTLEFMSAALDMFFDALGFPTVNLMGHSMGGIVSTHYAVTRSERVEHLVLASSAGLRGGVSNAVLFMHITPLASVYIKWMERNLERIMRTNNSCYDASVITDEMIAERRASFSTPDARWASANTLKRLIAPHHLESLLHRVRQPTLIVWGENDPVVSPRVARRFEHIIPNAELIMFPQCGHLIGIEKPHESSAAIHLFLTRSRPALSATA